MTIKQLSIFLENRGGTLIKVLDLLSRAGIQIIASTVADTQDFGLYRVLCSEPSRAFGILRDNGINVNIVDIIAISVTDEPGSAAKAVKLFSDNGISFLYMYSFLWKGKGVLAFRTDENDRAKELIMLNKLDFLLEENFK